MESKYGKWNYHKLQALCFYRCGYGSSNDRITFGYLGRPGVIKEALVSGKQGRPERNRRFMLLWMKQQSKQERYVDKPMQ